MDDPDDEIVDLSGIGVILAALMLAAIIALCGWVIVRNRPMPGDDMPLPSTGQQLQTPPDLFPAQEHDVKG